ncbi:co-chaperone YbbN [Kineococcus gynurae]|uniref:Co-chaperone YbbN n=1 Tax=Kineococcus gynurae TaxID=452979 RepID=A0ABV5LMY5_9ACTN
MSQPSAQPGPQLNLRGAVDLGAIAARNARREEVARRQAGDPVAAAPAPFVVDVTEQNFTEVVQQSAEVPVLVELWAEGYDTGAEVLVTLVGEAGGRLLLARIDAQAEPNLAQSLLQTLQARSVPLVAAIVKGQPIPLFTGSYPSAEEGRPLLEEVLRVAEANGVSGRLAGAEDVDQAAEPSAPPLPPLHAEALAALETGDLDAAAAAWHKALAQDPRDVEATAGLARVGVLRRLEGVDADAARSAAAAAPTDVAAQLVAADLDLAGGHVEDAFARLVRLVTLTAGEERDAARTHLLELFAVVGPDDPRVAKARLALSRALF